MDKRWVVAILCLFLVLALWPDPPEEFHLPWFENPEVQSFGPVWSSWYYCTLDHGGLDYGGPTADVRGYSSLLIAVNIHFACSLSKVGNEIDAVYARVGWRPSNSRLPELGVLLAGPDWDRSVFGILTWNGEQPYLAIDNMSIPEGPYLSWYGSPFCKQTSIDACKFDLHQWQLASQEN